VKPTAVKPTAVKPTDPITVLVANLKSRAKGKPAKLQTLSSDIKSQKLGRTDTEVNALIEKLRQQGKIVVTGTKVTYKL
jgi:biotin operon repressor